jgi:Homeodomain-like domain
MRRTNEKLRVHLSRKQRDELEALCRQQRTPASKLRRARILLMADEGHPSGHQSDAKIAEAVGLCARQVVRIRQKFIREGIAPTLSRKQRSTPPRPYKFDGKAEAKLVVLCCSTPPEGHRRWTLSLLVDELCRLQVVASVCPETVRQCLKKIASSRGAANGSVFPKGTGRGLWPTWRRSSTSTARRTTRSTR